jgi:hypothetical protein
VLCCLSYSFIGIAPEVWLAGRSDPRAKRAPVGRRLPPAIAWFPPQMHTWAADVCYQADHAMVWGTNGAWDTRWESFLSAGLARRTQRPIDPTGGAPVDDDRPSGPATGYVDPWPARPRSSTTSAAPTALSR